ncbi:SDR family oxidoreductase [Larkinella sp. C7]|jgi:short-subunit dehydrogenase|uniref:SDR family NAD(P)-dependent oxidoreductase n=1 Tax=Larkinella sp. C7 TaxID=2576607 RepID=UPI0011111209|nr:SDR family oxidoreductase [Larkinella sp. C7]
MTTKESKTALITGASSGIGQELAKLFAKDGYNLILVARSTDVLNELGGRFWDEYGVETTVITKDLSEEDAAQDVYNQVKAKNLSVDVLVNDAGVGLYGLFATETDWEREKSLIHLNVLTTTQMTKLFLKEMVERNEGKILNLASLVSITPMPLMAVYAATKAYIYNFTQSLINELKDTNVSVTALLPNATDTDFFNKAGAANTKATENLDNPATVAKDAYQALMKGASKVVPGGLVNKAYEVVSYVAPQETLAGMMRKTMQPKAEPKTNEKDNKAALTWGIGLAAVVLAGAAIALVYANSSEYDKVRYRYKAGKIKSGADDVYDDVKDSLLSGLNSIKDAVSTAKEVVAKAKETFAEALA